VGDAPDVFLRFLQVGKEIIVFDRLLVAQALAEDMALLSADEALDGYGVERIW
jgi:hypothetical protein